MTAKQKTTNPISQLVLLDGAFLLQNLYKRSFSSFVMMSASDNTEDLKLQDIFLEGWGQYEFLDETSIDTNSVEFQRKVKSAMEKFEIATTIVNKIGMFSPNEKFDEVSTESLQYLLLPFFLGKLALQRKEQDRGDALRIADIYFRDFLQRCHEYELCESPIPKKTDEYDDSRCINTTQQLVASAVTRNNKIAQYKRKKELEAQIKQMKAIDKCNADDEVKRDFFIKYINKSVIDANEELQNVELEKGVVEMRKQRMAEFGATKFDDFALPYSNDEPTDGGASYSHSRGHLHSHSEKNKLQPRPKPMQPFIITKNATQKAVFGLGYPSLPVMTVDEFYQQRVEDGIFPDAEKMARINEQKAFADTQDPNVQEEVENAAIERQIENDDPEYIERMRRMDEYKDVVRRGDGNRYNRS